MYSLPHRISILRFRRIYWFFFCFDVWNMSVLFFFEHIHCIFIDFLKHYYFDEYYIDRGFAFIFCLFHWFWFVTIAIKFSIAQNFNIKYDFMYQLNDSNHIYDFLFWVLVQVECTDFHVGFFLQINANIDNNRDHRCICCLHYSTSRSK